MSAYERAYELARDLNLAKEYRSYVEAKSKLENDRDNMEMLERFRQQQWEMQMAQIAGQEVEEDRTEHLENTYQLLCLNPVINEFLTAEYQFARLMSGIQKILADAVPAWFEAGGSKELVN